MDVQEQEEERLWRRRDWYQAGGNRGTAEERDSWLEHTKAMMLTEQVTPYIPLHHEK